MLKDKNILIVGGSSGIGLALTKQLEQSNRVFVASRSNESLQGIQCEHIPYDVVNDMLDTSALPDQLDGFVYCPGTINLRPFKALKAEAFKTDFEVNVMGAIKTLQAVLGKLNNAAPASVVFFSTVAVQTGMPFHASVATAKGALEGLARSLAAELAPKIRVNVIAPSLTTTPLADKFLNNETKLEKANQRHPLGRVGSAEEIAAAAAFLLGDTSGWMTGQIMHIDGGIGTLKT